MNTSEKTSFSIAEIVYLLYFAVMLGAKAIGLYEGQLAYNICLVVGAALFAVKVVITKHSVLEYVCIVLLLALGAVVYLKSGEKSLLIFLTMMLGIKGVSLDRVFKVGTIIWVTAFVSMYVLSVVGVIPEVAYMLDRRGWEPVLRHTLGYPHPNTLHVTYFILCVFVLYTCKDMTKLWIKTIAGVLLVGNIYVFIYSLSRNGFLVTTIYLAIVLFYSCRRNKSKAEDWIVALIYPFCSFCLIVLSFVAKGDFHELVNKIFAGRVVYTRYFLTKHSLQLFGNSDITGPEPRFVIDSSYVYLLYRLGIIAFVLYSAAVIWLIVKLSKERREAELAVVLALTIGGINETYLSNQSYKNLIFLFIGYFLYAELASLAQRHEQSLLFKKVGLGIGDREISFKRGEKGAYKRVPVNIWFFASILLVVCGIAVSLIYAAASPKARDIYVPESEYLIDRGEEVFLTREEVNEYKKAGDIIRGYVDENTPLYRIYSSGPAKIEHLRYTLSYGLWAGSIVTIVFLLVWTTRYKVRIHLKNRKIGEDYKENVLIVHNYYRIPGGEDIVVANEKALLEAHGHKVTLYSRNNDEAGDHSFLQKIGLAFVSLFNVRTYRDICRIIDKEKIDVIQVHNTIALVSPAVYIAGINRGVPVIQTIHNFRLVCPNGVCYVKDHVCERCLEHGLKSSLLYNCYRDSKLQTFVCALTMKFQRFLRSYRAIYYICLTDFNKQKLLTLKQIKEDHVYLKPNFTTISEQGASFENRKKQIVYAGRLEKIKGVDMLLQAWMKLGNKAPKLIICGSGELENWCKEYIANNEIENVEMLGQIPNEDVKKLVGESLAMIYPTQWYEGFPMAVAEAYTMGTPIIASDIGNVGNLVDDGVSGLKFKNSSVVALAKAVEQFMENPIELPKEYLTRYTADKNYEMLKDIFEDVRRKGFE